MQENQQMVVLVAAVIGFVLGCLFMRMRYSRNVQQVKELKAQLNKANKTQEDTINTVNEALTQVKELAVNMATTYHLLEVTKSSLEGTENKASQEFLLKIKNGKAELLNSSTTLEGNAEDLVKTEEPAEGASAEAIEAADVEATQAQAEGNPAEPASTEVATSDAEQAKAPSDEAEAQPASQSPESKK